MPSIPSRNGDRIKFFQRLALACFAVLVINLVITFALVAHEIDQVRHDSQQLDQLQVAACEHDNATRRTIIHALQLALKSETPAVREGALTQLHIITSQPGINAEGVEPCPADFPNIPKP